MTSLQKQLQTHFGFPDFRLGQQEVIENLLAGHSSLAIFPTGGGKSICYQLPALLLDGITLVISPLIALMKDQVEALERKGIAATRLDSSLEPQDWARTQQQIESGEIKIVYVSPERFANESFRKWISQIPIALMAIDEAHCLSEWGHSFRPDYLKLPKIAKQIKAQRVLCLTATATKQVSKDIRNAFKIKVAHFTQTPFARPHLRLNVEPTTKEERDTRLLEHLRSHPQESAIVYVTQQNTAEQVATYLQKNQLSAQAFHAGLPTELKQEIQERFMAGEIKTIIATIAFGMGVDKADIRHVYHYNLPKTIENYIQETGRAGRDRQPSTCTTLACGDDLTTLEGFILGSTPSPEAIKSFIEFCTRPSKEVVIDHYHLSTSLDMTPIVIDTLLTYLELANILEAKGTRYTTYKAKLVRSMHQILAGHTPERSRFLQKLFSTGSVYKGIYYTFLINDSAEVLGVSPDKVGQALKWLEKHGDLTLKLSAPRSLFKIKKDRSTYDIQQLIADQQATFAQREEADLQRLNQVIDYVQHPRCLSQYLLDYFGEKDSHPCGTCTSCHDADESGKNLNNLRSKRRLPLSVAPEILSEDLERIQLLLKENHQALRTPKQLARFLAGLKSPALRKHKLYQHSLYGVWQDRLFTAILTQCESF